MILTQFTATHHAAVYSLRKALAVKFEAFCFLAWAHVGDFVRQIRAKGETVGAAFRRTGKGGEEAVAIIVEAFAGNKAHAIVNFWCHHVCLYSGILHLMLTWFLRCTWVWVRRAEVSIFLFIQIVLTYVPFEWLAGGFRGIFGQSVEEVWVSRFSAFSWCDAISGCDGRYI